MKPGSGNVLRAAFRSVRPPFRPVPTLSQPTGVCSVPDFRSFRPSRESDEIRVRPSPAPVRTAVCKTREARADHFALALARFQCSKARRESGALADRVLEHANAADFDFDRVAWLHAADAFGRAGHDHVAWLERHYLTEKGNEKWHAEDQIPGRGRLARRSIQPRCDADISDIGDARFDHRPERAIGIETLGANPLAVFLLKHAVGDIVAAGVAEHVVE